MPDQESTLTTEYGGEGVMRYLPPKTEVGPAFSGLGKFKILLLNTNPYRIGIANLGWQVIAKHLLETYPHVSVRAEYVDTIEYAGAQWSDFNLIAVHIPFETNYPAVIQMLYKIGLPVFKRQRRDDFFPLVVGGGIYNPLPLVDFVDIFVIGDGRLPLASIVDTCFEEQNKDKVLAKLREKKVRGIFIPNLHKGGESILASPELPLRNYPIHTIWSTADNVYGLPPDYLSIMVALGCRYRCPFCVVSHCQGIAKVKETEIETNQVLEILNWRRQFISVKTVKLFFASSINQNSLKEMLRKLIIEGVEVLVGSLNCKQIDEELVALLQQSGQNRITIAPETNKEQRWKVNKGYITDERVFEIVRLANRYHLPLSLYLMYCLPGETDDDIIELGRLVREVRQVLDSRLEMQVHCNQVYLKPHTPWQFAGQISLIESASKLRLLQTQFANIPGIEIRAVDLYSAMLQSLLTRGDEQMGRFLASIAFAPPRNLKELIERVRRLIPNWQRYYNERRPSEIPWSQIVFQNHGILWQRWANLKSEITKGGDK